MNRLRIKIVGESGSGLLSTGEMLMSALHRMGFYIVSDREYPSLIKGGYSCFTLNASTTPIYSLSQEADVMIMLDRQGFEGYKHELKNGGILIHGYERKGIDPLIQTVLDRKCKVYHLPARHMAEEQGGNVLMTNVILLGMFWNLLGFDLKAMREEVEERFAHKPELLKIDLKCLDAGYKSSTTQLELTPPKKHKGIVKVLDGNRALTLGAIHAGVRAYYAYPMSPSSTILTYMSEAMMAKDLVVKQAEDEITAAQMALGSMFMGTRALTATSGGGFDLMTETLSLAGMIETPFVVVIAQRPGPATGLPTWTAQADLQLAMHAGHGEFPRIVIGVSNPEDCFELIQHALNWAELYQSPVLVLTEKVVAESFISTPAFKEGKIKIQRGLVQDSKELKALQSSDRFKFTPNGLSKRWIPGSSPAYYYANGDEHTEDGSLTEGAESSAAMIDKRMKKMKLIEAAMPEPEVFGSTKPDISFVGWGSSKNVMMDAIEAAAKLGIKVNYLHFSVVHPLKTKTLKAFFKKYSNVHLIEGNYQGQFGQLVEATGLKFKGKHLKYNGRPFFLEDALLYIRKHS